MIELQGVRHTYRTDSGVVEALRGVDLRIERGEMVALIGESGSGISSLLNILACLDVPTEGRYLLDGSDMGQLSRRQLTRRRADQIGVVSPSFDLLPDASVLRNLELPLLYLHVEARRRRARQALHRVGLDSHHDDIPTQLLPGQRHQVLIARALINNPPILLYDQPSHELDSQASLDIMRLLGELNRNGTTIVFCTPDHHHADAHASRVLSLHDGHITQDRYRPDPQTRPGTGCSGP